MDDVWRIRRGDREWFLVDASALNEWAAAGHVRPSDRIYNPARQSWTIAANVPEILTTLARAQIRNRQRNVQVLAFCAVLIVLAVTPLFMPRIWTIVSASVLLATFALLGFPKSRR